MCRVCCVAMRSLKDPVGLCFVCKYGGAHVNLALTAGWQIADDYGETGRWAVVKSRGNLLLLKRFRSLECKF